MDRLVFIDDDADEIDKVRELVKDTYEYLGLQWPKQLPDKMTIGEPEPVIFVSDLYVPPQNHRDDITDFSDEMLLQHVEVAQQAAAAFLSLYPGPGEAKRRMRMTMDTLGRGRELLDRQWRALGQSPDHGIEILRLVRSEYPTVPFVFYSRKITPDDVVRALDAGADDAIQKREWNNPREFLDRLRKARDRHKPS